ncbi:MAG: hypothetical protein ACJAU1_000438 [Psychromonas sp.]|jgi:hypothetical protein
MSALRYYQPSSSLNRLFSHLPHAPYCSDDKTARLKLTKTKALSFPYIQVDTANLKNWLVFDLDHDNPMIWDDESLPPPNFMVVCPTKNTSHLFYAIPGVATSVNSRSAPIQYMKAVYEAMAIRLNADLSYSGPVAKTPGHAWWRTHEFHNKMYDLGELSEYVDLETKPQWSKGPDLDSVSHSRNCTLFEITRFFAYAKVSEARRKSTLAEFEAQVRNYATARNRFKEKGWQNNLAYSEIKATAKSIARWTWDYYRGDSVHRGAMGLDSQIPLPERQSSSALRTAKMKRGKTEVAIRNAVLKAKESGAKISCVSIARLTGLCRQTVASYLNVILKNLNPIISLNDLLNTTNSVKLGVYQIDPIFSEGINISCEASEVVQSEDENDTS